MMYGLDGRNLQGLRIAADTNIRFGPAAMRRPGAEKRVPFLIIYVSLYICPQRRKEAQRSGHVRGPRETELTLRGKRRKPSPRGIGPCSAGRVTDLEKMRDKAGQVLYKMKK